MNFKPIFSSDELDAAEAELARVVEEMAAEAARQSKPIISAARNPATASLPTAKVSPASADSLRTAVKQISPDNLHAGEIIPEIRIAKIKRPIFSKLSGFIGITAPRKRFDLLEKIGRTVAFGVENGLREAYARGNKRPYIMTANLYNAAMTTKQSNEDLTLTLGWIQCAIILTCPKVVASKVRSL